MFDTVKRLSFLICISVVFFITFGCDDEKKTVCCECTCVKEDVTGKINESKDTIKGEDLDCREACKQLCIYNPDKNVIDYTLKNGIEIECTDDIK